jgi:hypothetical protein
MICQRKESMSTDCYQIACEHATREISEINAQIESLTRRKELLENLLEPLKLLVPESGAAAIPVEVSEILNIESPESEADPQESAVVVLGYVEQPEYDPFEAPVPTMQPDVEETDLDATRNGRSISYEDVAGLAYSFWIERGQAHGHHEEDWLRAAHELQNIAD